MPRACESGFILSHYVLACTKNLTCVKAIPSIEYGRKELCVILQAALLATSKVAERTLASGVLEHPSDPRYGKIMFVIDIPLPLIVGEAVEKAIVSTIKEEYFETERRSPLYQFEDTI